jgi:formylglycine-generating enzyme required for sulfatase activity
MKRVGGGQKRIVSCLRWAALCLGLCACGGSALQPQALFRPELLSQAGLRTAAGSLVDARTGWPQRVVHEKSGAVLVLIPAGEFLMGSPAVLPRRDGGDAGAVGAGDGQQPEQPPGCRPPG